MSCCRPTPLLTCLPHPQPHPIPAKHILDPACTPKSMIYSQVTEVPLTSDASRGGMSALEQCVMRRERRCVRSLPGQCGEALRRAGATEQAGRMRDPDIHSPASVRMEGLRLDAGTQHLLLLQSGPPPSGGFLLPKSHLQTSPSRSLSKTQTYRQAQVVQ